LSLIRYSLIGGVATFVHYLVLVALIEGASMNPGLSAAIGATCGALTGYAGNRHFTFFSHAPHRRALPRFIVVAAGAAITNGTIVWTGTEWLGLHYLVPQVAATALTLVVGFTLNRSWTFA
jgi:putative flippase GtrA